MHYVIIGASAAGISAVEGIREIDKTSKVTLIGDEKLPLYSRCLLGYLLAGTINEANLFFKKKDFFEKHNCEAILGARAEQIDLRAQTVTTHANRKIPFDKLLIATGSRPKMPDCAGIDKHGIFALRTIKDARGIEKALEKARTAVILGGGLIGLRAAHALNSRGVIVKIIMKSGHVLSQMLDPKAADIIQDRIEQKGITLMKGLEAKEILGDEVVKGVLLSDGTRLDCDMVIAAKGSDKNIELAKEAGIDTQEGIIADEYLETSAKGVFTAGDVTQTKTISSGAAVLTAIWPTAIEAGRTAGRTMAGKKQKYDGLLYINSIEFFGLPVTARGITRPGTKEYEESVTADKNKGLYKKIVLKDNVIHGFLSVGEVKEE